MVVSFRIDVVVNPANAVAGTKVVNQALRGTEIQANRLRTTLLGAFGIFGAAQFIRSTIGTLSNFEEAMATVKAVTSATGKEFAALRQQALDLGLTTRFTATNAAEGLVLLGRAGLSADESLRSVASTLNLAVAGGLDLAAAADVSLGALKGFGLGVNQLGRVTDVLAAASINSKTTVQELGDALKFVGPVAAGVGVSLEETVAALGFLSNAGLKASLAGTGFKRILAELEGPTAATTKFLNRLGLSTNDVRISSVGLTTALARLKDAGVDTGLALQIFGQRGGPAEEVLARLIPELDKFTEALDNSGGTAKKTADIIDDSLFGTIKRLVSSFESLKLQIGEGGATSGLRGLVEGLAAGFRFLAGNAEILIKFVDNLALFLGPRYLLGAINAVSVAIAANPIGLLLTILAAVIATIPDLQTKLTDLVGTIGELGSAITGSVDFTALLEGIASTVDNTIALFNGLLAGASVVFDAIGSKPEVAGELIKSAMRRAVEASVLFFLAFAQTVGNILVGIGRDTLGVIENSILATTSLLKGQTENADTFKEIVISNLNRAANRVSTFTGQFTGNLKKLEDVQLLGNKTELSQEAANLGVQVSDEFNRAIAESTPTAREALDNLLGKDLTAEAARRAAELALITPKPAPSAPEALPLTSRAQEILDQVDATRALEVEEAALQEVLNARPDLLREINDAYLQAQIAALEASTAVEDGFTRAFFKLQQEAQDFASVAEAAVNSFADQATDALATFLTTGEGSFKQFANAIIADLIRILVRLLIVQAISAALGVAGGGAGGLVSNSTTPQGRAKGGPVQSGRSFIVGENGPELFQPTRSGNIVPNAADAPAATPAPVNVQVVNISDPNEIPGSIESGRADEAIINMLQRNKSRVAQVIR